MSLIADFILATFTAPEYIGTDPKQMLWLLPLSAAIAIAYKATKLRKITALNFIKEAGLLFASIVVFMVVTAIVLLLVARFVTE